MTLDTQVNLAKSDKVSFYNKKEWLEEYEYGKTYFIVNVMMIRTVRLVKIMIATEKKVQVKSYPVHIGVQSYFSCFSLYSPIFYCLFQAMRKDFPKVSMMQRSKSKQQQQKQPAMRHLKYIPFLRITETHSMCSSSVERGTSNEKFLMSMANSITEKLSIATKNNQFVGKK